MLALNYYEAAAPQNPEGSGIFAHSDLEGKLREVGRKSDVFRLLTLGGLVFTILCQDSVKSLEVLSNTGAWLPANPIPGRRPLLQSLLYLGFD